MTSDETQTMVTEREIVRFVAADGGVWWDSDGVEGRCDFCGAELWDDGTDEIPFPHRSDCKTMQARALLVALGDPWMGQPDR
jgi:hypothetical protein